MGELKLQREGTLWCVFCVRGPYRLAGLSYLPRWFLSMYYEWGIWELDLCDFTAWISRECRNKAGEDGEIEPWAGTEQGHWGLLSSATGSSWAESLPFVSLLTNVGPRTGLPLFASWIPILKEHSGCAISQPLRALPSLLCLGIQYALAECWLCRSVILL